MAKKQVAVSLRKPPPADADSFVSGAPVTPAPPTTALAGAAEGTVVTTRLGDRRELTVYLPNDLAKKLALRCLELRCDSSAFIETALAAALVEGEPAPAPPISAAGFDGAFAPTSRWGRLLAQVVAHVPLPRGIRFA